MLMFMDMDTICMYAYTYPNLAISTYVCINVWIYGGLYVCLDLCMLAYM